MPVSHPQKFWLKWDRMWPGQCPQARLSENPAGEFLKSTGAGTHLELLNRNFWGWGPGTSNFSPEDCSVGQEGTHQGKAAVLTWAHGDHLARLLESRALRQRDRAGPPAACLTCPREADGAHLALILRTTALKVRNVFLLGYIPIFKAFFPKASFSPPANNPRGRRNNPEQYWE